MQFIGVIDIGKTNAKCAAVDLASLTERAVRTAPNISLKAPPFAHFNTDRLWAFITSALAELNREYPLDAISVTTHGACAALVSSGGGLTLPVLDYESPEPDRLAAQYDVMRPRYAQTYSPRLPAGLNLGAQLNYLQQTHPDAFSSARWILTWPQYWSFRLTGEPASELTSLGCHTDLWAPSRQSFSDLAMSPGWSGKFPPLRKAYDVLGETSPEVTAALELPHALPVTCGIHDSNASLLPYLLTKDASFSIVSSGTWTVVFSPGGTLELLDERRDCLANIDALGRPTPSARFMGGREYEILSAGRRFTSDRDIEDRVLRENRMLLPSIQQGSGPFPHSEAHWTHDEPGSGDPERGTLADFYIAMMSAQCVELAGGNGDIFIEGPFASNAAYCRMLASATECRTFAAPKSTGTSIGAALLADWGNAPAHAAPHLTATREIEADPRLSAYAGHWREAVQDL